MPIYVKRECILNTNKFHFDQYSPNLYCIYFCDVSVCVKNESVFMTTCVKRVSILNIVGIYVCTIFSAIASNRYGFRPKRSINQALNWNKNLQHKFHDIFKNVLELMQYSADRYKPICYKNMVQLKWEEWALRWNRVW